MRFYLFPLLLATTAGCAQKADPLSSTESDSLAALAWVAGVWSGSLSRHYDDGGWTVRLQAEPEKEHYNTHYVRRDAPDLLCTGTLTILQAEWTQAGPRLRFDQDLQSNSCLHFNDGGQLHEFAVVLLSALEGGEQAYIGMYYGPEGPWGGHNEASGVLEKETEERP